MIKKLIAAVLILLLFLLVINIAKSETYVFGAYWQTFEPDGIKSPIEWYILDETQTSLLLISKYSLDANIFNHTEYTTWENSQMRQFLNTYFYDNAFCEAEKARIILSPIETLPNTVYASTDQGPRTQDFVFLLSVQEVEKYFFPRVALATGFARLGHKRIIGDKWAGAYTSPVTGATCWRLRTMGIDNLHVTNVREDGTISYSGDVLFAPHYAIRPCIWIKKDE